MPRMFNDRDSLGPQLPANRKVMLVELCRDEFFQTNDSTTYSGRDIELPELRNLGPLIEKLRAHIEVKEATTNFQARVSMQFSVTGRKYEDPVALLADVTGADGQEAGAYYSNEQNIGPFLQFNVESANISGTATESGRVTAYLEITLKS